ncbi:damage-inducible protein DinB [Frigidibacter albus]|uniref:Damage-inducible protein DinB n=2 Tax=Frigidibacter albus TaxID=1465486 RepID=A0A6L8VE81_9RHOB|nr:damage-inducible protein DinB [Frigidibacter albus]NBE30320.1 damage-inducible protein DinB [Frigidibacter albus]
MARYNAWQNDNLYAAAALLEDEGRRAPRGAFFGSIHATLNHLLWADRMWLSRFGRGEAPGGGIAGSVALVAEWQALCAARRDMDAVIVDWADALAPEDLAGDLAWYSGASGREMTRPKALCVLHLFNHQTHHRGQVHAMLTAAGAVPGPTDLVFAPGEMLGA